MKIKYVLFYKRCMLCAGDTKMVKGKSAQYKFLWQGYPEGIHCVEVLVSGVCG